MNIASSVFTCLALSTYTELGYLCDLQILFIQRTLKQTPLPYTQAVTFQTDVFKHWTFVNSRSASQHLHSPFQLHEININSWAYTKQPWIRAETCRTSLETFLGYSLSSPEWQRGREPLCNDLQLQIAGFRTLLSLWHWVAWVSSLALRRHWRQTGREVRKTARASSFPLGTPRKYWWGMWSDSMVLRSPGQTKTYYASAQWAQGLQPTQALHPGSMGMQCWNSGHQQGTHCPLLHETAFPNSQGLTTHTKWRPLRVSEEISREEVQLTRDSAKRHWGQRTHHHARGRDWVPGPTPC